MERRRDEGASARALPAPVPPIVEQPAPPAPVAPPVRTAAATGSSLDPALVLPAAVALAVAGGGAGGVITRRARRTRTG